MTDIKIPHDRLPALRRMLDGSIIPADMDVVREFIAAAEADRPPLPEGWVLVEADGQSFPYWHDDGHLYQGVTTDGAGTRHHDLCASYDRDHLTPLRPTVTAEDVERAAEALREERMKGACHDFDAVLVRVALNAAGVVIEP